MAKRRLKDWISSFIEYNRNSEPPELYKEWVAISLIASVLQRKCYLPWGDLTFYPNMYIVLVGPSGKCRKGTAMSPGLSLLRELGITMSAEAITREALIRELRKSNKTDIEQESGKTNIHASLTIYSQELTVFLGYNNVQLMSDLTDWYDCRDQWTYRTKNMGTDKIVGVWVNLIGATTPELLQTTLPRDAIGGGLTSRMIFVYASKKSRVIAAPFLTEKETLLREEMLIDLELIGTMKGAFTVTPEFLEIYVPWYEGQEGSPPFEDFRFSGYFERRPAHLLKLCVILSASSRNDRKITAEIFERALKLMEKTEQPMPYAFSGIGKSEHADVLARVSAFIASKGETTMKDILKAFLILNDLSVLEMGGLLM